MVLTPEVIKRRAGNTYFQRGQAYYQQQRVTSCQQDEQDSSHWIGKVQGRVLYTVDIVALPNGEIDAACECPAFVTGSWCKHIVAVLLNLVMPNIGHPKPPAVTPAPKPAPAVKPPLPAAPVVPVKPAAPSAAQRLLAIYRNTARTSRLQPPLAIRPGQPRLQAQFILRPSATYYRSGIFLIEMKVGLDRLYVVQNIEEFLQKTSNGQPHVFSKRFTFDPTLHAFEPKDLAVVEALQDVRRQDSFYQKTFNPYGSRGYSGYSGYGGTNSRRLYIPPFAWESLISLLRGANTIVAYEHGGEWALDPDPAGLPMTAVVKSTPGGQYALQIEGLDRLMIMEAYRCALAEGSIYPLDEIHLARIAELKTVVMASSHEPIEMSGSDLEAVMDTVIPDLRSFAVVRIAKEVANRIANHPLIVRLYLDRDEDELSVKVRYVYGESILDALAPADRRGEEGLILLRDSEGEERILSALLQAGFTARGQVLYLEGETQLYQFLFNVLPFLEQSAEVFVTQAVHSMVGPSSYQPKARLEIDEKTGWLDVSFDFGDLSPSDIQQVLAAIIEKRPYHRLPDGAFVPLSDEAFQQIGELMADMGLNSKELEGGSLKLPGHRALALIEHDDRQMAVKLGKSLRRWLDNLRNPDNLDFQAPETLGHVLRDYQRYGFQWMKTLAHYGFGGILADDMGLGKTLQSIAFLLSEREGGPFQHPVLIICPASLVYNWESEIHKFAPSLTSAVVAGTRSQRAALLERPREYDVLITSYPLLRRDLQTYSSQRFHTLILDEAQAIKNHATQTAQAIFDLRSDHRFALTGTPVENSLDDLWSIFHAVFPGLFGDREEFSQLPPEIVARRVRPFLLRRLKKDVLKELPEKIETVNTTDLAVEQKKIYLAYLAQLRKETARDLSVETFHKSRFKILAGLTRLRQICCHPGLFVENYQGESGKLDQLLEIIDEGMGADKRMLIFSQFTSMLAIIRSELDQRGISYFYLDGSTPVADRLDLCNRFNDGQRRIFLISLKAGGTGLNLTGADTVILYDLWWNPAVEEQAADRAHRIGQKRSVQVIRLITKGTIEEKIYELQQKKRHLIDQVVQANDEGLSALTEDDVRELLSL